MPSTVGDLFEHAGLRPGGVARWGSRVPVPGPGVYVVALAEAVDSTAEALDTPPLSDQAIKGWLDVRRELRLDGSRPSPEELAQRLAALWLPDEVLLYVGLAGTSVRSRVDQYYETPLGARRPHAGGHLLKTLANLDHLFVHVAAASDPSGAEYAMLRAFVHAVSDVTRTVLADPDHPFPFANLEWPAGTRKAHGVTGWRGEIPSRSETGAQPSPTARSSSVGDRGRGNAPASGQQPRLHDEIARILRENGNRWMTTEALAEAVTAAGRYHKKDGSTMTAFQIHGRTRQYPELFERDGSRVRLREDIGS